MGPAAEVVADIQVHYGFKGILKYYHGGDP
jgi:hypothetical protein